MKGVSRYANNPVMVLSMRKTDFLSIYLQDQSAYLDLYKGCVSNAWYKRNRLSPLPLLMQLPPIKKEESTLMSDLTQPFEISTFHLKSIVRQMLCNDKLSLSDWSYYKLTYSVISANYIKDNSYSD